MQGGRGTVFFVEVSEYSGIDSSRRAEQLFQTHIGSKMHFKALNRPISTLNVAKTVKFNIFTPKLLMLHGYDLES